MRDVRSDLLKRANLTQDQIKAADVHDPAADVLTINAVGRK
jgi:hypothetical protein